MQAELFTLVVKAGETKDIEIPFGANIVLSNAALAGAANKESATVILNHMENHLALCTLTAGAVPQYRMNILVTRPEDESESDEDEEKSDDEEKELPAPSITVKGKGTVHIVGKYVASGEADDGEYDDEDMDDEDMDDEDMDDEDMDDMDDDDEDDE